MAEADARGALRAFDRSALLVTPDLLATQLPFYIENERLIGHVARANPHWKSAPCAALVVMAGAEAYVSPNWYPSKAAHGRAVPTWNYVTLHVRGTLTTFEDAARLEAVVARLWETLYQPGKHRDLWFQWQGRPLLLAPPEVLTEEMKAFFTVRQSWAWTKSWGGGGWFADGRDKWPWLDTAPQGFGSPPR